MRSLKDLKNLISESFGNDLPDDKEALQPAQPEASEKHGDLKTIHHQAVLMVSSNGASAQRFALANQKYERQPSETSQQFSDRVINHVTQSHSSYDEHAGEASGEIAYDPTSMLDTNHIVDYMNHEENQYKRGSWFPFTQTMGTRHSIARMDASTGHKSPWHGQKADMTDEKNLAGGAHTYIKHHLFVE